MCDRVFMKVGGAWKDASTRSELRKLLGVEPLYDPLPSPNEDDCLCSCDVPGTAKAAGFSAVYDAGDWELKPGLRR